MITSIARASRTAALLFLIALGVVTLVGCPPGQDPFDCTTKGEGRIVAAYAGGPMDVELSDLIVPEGQDVELHHEVGVPPSAHDELFQWLRSDDGVTYTPIPGATGRNYTLRRTVYGRDDSANFRVEHSYQCEQSPYTDTPPEGQLHIRPMTDAQWVEVDARGDPTQPADVTVAVGATATFSALAFGKSTYQWERSTDGFQTATPVVGATTWKLDVPAVQASDNGAMFRLRVTNIASGSVLLPMRAARLTVSTLPPSFDAALNAMAISVGQGSSQTVSLTLTPQNAFTGNIDIAAMGLPSGMTITPNSVNVSGTAPVTQALTVAVNNAVSIGNYSLTLTASAGSVQQQLPLTVSVTAAPDFSIAASSLGVLAVPGRPKTVDVTVTPTNGLGGTVTLNLQNVPGFLTVTPPGPVTLTFNGANPITQTYSVLVSIHAPDSDAYSFTVAASAGATSHSVAINVGTVPPATVGIQIGFVVEESRTSLTRTGTGYSARVDLAHGEAGVLLDSTAGTNAYDSIGPSRLLTFSNRTNAAVVLPAQALRFVIEGTYITVPGGSMSMNSILVVVIGNAPAISAGVFHTVTGTLASESSVTTDEHGGATVNVIQADSSGLRAELRMPQLTIPAGGSASVSFLLAASFASGGDQMDFLTIPAKLCLALPAGVTLEDNSAVPLSWCQ